MKLRFRWIVGAACGFVLGGCAATGDAASRPAPAALVRDRTADVAATVPRWRSLMLDGLHRDAPIQKWWLGRDPKFEPTTAFDGSFDRHSNMAAHWALLVDARLAGDAETIRAITERFDAAALDCERAFVDATQSRAPMRPYDQTWLVLFLAELERHATPDAAAAARRLRSECEARLLDFCEAEPVDPVPASAPASQPVASRPSSSPTSSRTASRATSRPRVSAWTSGAYGSALWPLIVLDLAGTTIPSSAARLRALERTKLVATAEKLVGAETRNAFRGGQGYDFFHPSSLAALALRTAALTAPEGPRPPAFATPPAEELPDKITLMNCHRLGCEVAKLWPLAFDAGAGDVAARTALDARLAAFLVRTEAWDGDFLTTSHWVPQFLFFTAWLAAGRP